MWFHVEFSSPQKFLRGSLCDATLLLLVGVAGILTASSGTWLPSIPIWEGGSKEKLRTHQHRRCRNGDLVPTSMTGSPVSLVIFAFIFR